MAKKKSMTMEEAIQAILASCEDNPFRMMLEFMAQNVLEWEMTEHLGAGLYERTEERRGYRNGYRPRVLTAAVGDLHLLVPRDRDGTFSTSLFERYQRSDKALVLALMEMYLKGVSTRKVAAITERLCGRSFSSQLVSKLAEELDEKLEAWRERNLEGEYPYLIVDAPLREGPGMRQGHLPGDPHLRGHPKGWQAGDPYGGDCRHRVPSHLVGPLPKAQAAGPFRDCPGGLR